MNFARFEPWSIVDLLHRDFDRLAANRLRATNGSTSVADWVPAVDIVEEHDRFVLRADLPGVDPAGIEVSTDDGVLSLAGERPAPEQVTEHGPEHGERTGVRHIERASGRFFRRFSLPDTADASAVKANSKNGILEIVIPKLPEVQTRRITVEAA